MHQEANKKMRRPEMTKPRGERGNVGAVYGAESNGSE